MTVPRPRWAQGRTRFACAALCVALTGTVATACGAGDTRNAAPTPVAQAAPGAVATTAAARGTTPATSARTTSARTTSARETSASPASTVSASTVPASAPSASAPSASRPSGPPSITLAFAGDVHFEGVDASRLAADPHTAIGPMADVLRSADLAMVNLESAVTTRGTPAVKAYTFRAPATAFTALRAAGIDVVTMANNHGEDYGPVGLQDSLAAAAAAHFPVVGIGADEDAAFAPYDVSVKGQRIAIIGATQVLDGDLESAWSAGPDKAGLASAYDVPRLVAAVKAARAQADLVVVYLHWGRELAACPTAAQRDIAQQLADAGADVVVGTHAHVQLGAGRLGNTFVDYGLGNFVFYAGSGVTARSGVLLLTVTGRRVTADRWVPAQVENGVPVPLAGAAAVTGLAEWNSLAACTGLAPVG